MIIPANLNKYILPLKHASPFKYHSSDSKSGIICHLFLYPTGNRAIIPKSCAVVSGAPVDNVAFISECFGRNSFNEIINSSLICFNASTFSLFSIKAFIFIYKFLILRIIFFILDINLLFLFFTIFSFTFFPLFYGVKTIKKF